jgi:hypothetical protein
VERKGRTNQNENTETQHSRRTDGALFGLGHLYLWLVLFCPSPCRTCVWAVRKPIEPRGGIPTVHLPSAASTSLMMSFRFCHLRLKCQGLCHTDKNRHNGP